MERLTTCDLVRFDGVATEGAADIDAILSSMSLFELRKELAAFIQRFHILQEAKCDQISMDWNHTDFTSFNAFVFIVFVDVEVVDAVVLFDV